MSEQNDYNLLKEIIIVSEKAANIARICRQDEHLLKLLTQEKSEIEKNQRFAQDFKTLADVLIQELIKYYLIGKFSFLKDNIYGEESNTFTNSNGDTIIIEITDDMENIKQNLITILNGDIDAAELLTNCIYKEPNLPLSNEEIEKLPFIRVKENQFGIWIDPIDSTAEYIHGNLSCALTLIGVYNKVDGSPALGIINQPFSEELSEGWKSQIYWGVCLEDIKQHSELPMQEFQRESLKIAISSSENHSIQDCLLDNGYELLPLPGAGYKILSVILNKCDLYICTKSSTFIWDTLAGHSILNSLNGNVIECNKNKCNIKYNDKDNKCNKFGIIVYRNKKYVEEIIEKIQHLIE